MSDKDKKAFALRINQQLLRELEQWAADEFRSTNGQIEFLLHTALKSRKKSSAVKPVKKEPGEQI